MKKRLRVKLGLFTIRKRSGFVRMRDYARTRAVFPGEIGMLFGGIRLILSPGEDILPTASSFMFVHDSHAIRAIRFELEAGE